MFKMKVYLQGLDIDTYRTLVENKGDKLLGKRHIKNESWLLTADGKYKIIDDNYFKYKLKSSTEKIHIENYFENKDIFCEKGYFKKMHQVYNVPLHHHKIKITKIIYNRDPSISLIIEKTNDVYSDIYFWTSNDINEMDIKSAIASFTQCLT